MANQEMRLNHTIYINNLNEKIKKDGMVLSDLFLFSKTILLIVHVAHLSSSFDRIEEVVVCYILPVWPNSGHPCFSYTENEGSGLCDLQGDKQCFQCTPLYARLPIL